MIVTKRKTQRLYRRALDAYREGIYFQQGYKHPAPGDGPLRIAFDAGREAVANGSPGARMPFNVWQAVLASWFAS